MKDKISGLLERLDKKTVLINLAVWIFGGALLGFAAKNLLRNFSQMILGLPLRLDFSVYLEADTWLVGQLAMVVLWAVFWVLGGHSGGRAQGGGLLKGRADKAQVESTLENSRFLTDKERDQFFPAYTYDRLPEAKKDGVPVRAILDKKGKLNVNFYPGCHSLVIGATGSGKTTTFINPMIQLLGATDCGSSMIMTDPKGELFSLHSKFLKDRGYDVLLLDLRDTYSSSR